MTTTPPAHRSVGTARTRVEGRDKVTGAARYAAEIPFTGLAHGWLVLSTITRGRIREIHTAPVLDMPGVLTVLHHGNAPACTPTTSGCSASRRTPPPASSSTTGCRSPAGPSPWSWPGHPSRPAKRPRPSR